MAELTHSEDQPIVLLVAGAFETRQRALAWYESANLLALQEVNAGNDTSKRYRNLGSAVLGGDELRDNLIILEMGTIPGMGPMPGSDPYDVIYKKAADRIAAKIEKIQKQRQSTSGRIHLIGHSMGGNVATEFAHDNYGLVSTVTTQGTPYGGIDRLSDLIAQKNQALTASSNRIRQERAYLKSIGKPVTELFALGSTNDVTVEPMSALPDFADHHELIAVESPSHVKIMSHPQAIEFCGRVIAGGVIERRLFVFTPPVPSLAA